MALTLPPLDFLTSQIHMVSPSMAWPGSGAWAWAAAGARRARSASAGSRYRRRIRWCNTKLLQSRGRGGCSLEKREPAPGYQHELVATSLRGQVRSSALLNSHMGAKKRCHRPLLRRAGLDRRRHRGDARGTLPAPPADVRRADLLRRDRGPTDVGVDLSGGPFVSGPAHSTDPEVTDARRQQLQPGPLRPHPAANRSRHSGVRHAGGSPDAEAAFFNMVLASTTTSCTGSASWRAKTATRSTRSACCATRWLRTTECSSATARSS